MVDNPIYIALTESSRVIGDTTAAATAAAATAAGELDSPRPPSPLLALCGEDATNAPISCGPTELLLLLHWVNPRAAMGHVRARIM